MLCQEEEEAFVTYFLILTTAAKKLVSFLVRFICLNFRIDGEVIEFLFFTSVEPPPKYQRRVSPTTEACKATV